jgi:uncharacterized membrane protein (DUF2068 family)
VEVESHPPGTHRAGPDRTMDDVGPAVHPSKRERVGLELVAAYSFVKAIALVAAGLGALGLLNGRVAIAANRWLEGLALRHESRLAGRMADYVLPYLDRVTGRHLIEIAIGAFFFAAIYVVEGVGLWRCRRWAEYLTIGVSASFLPFELIALFHRVTLPLMVTFILNVAVVAFLLWQVRVAEKPLTIRE